jgi:hypothetical protein
LRSLSTCAKEMSEQEVSNSLSGLGRLGARWEELPETVRKLLGYRFALVSKDPSFGPRGLSMSIHGLGRMEASWSRLPTALRGSLLTSIESIAPKLNAQEISNVLYGLGKMGVIWADLPMSIKTHLLDAFAREAWRMNSQGVANSCWGLMMLAVEWSVELNGVVRSAVWDGIRREAMNFDEQELTNVIHALSKMEVAYTAIPLDVRSLFLQGLAVQLPLMAPAGLVMVLVGLAKQKIEWSSMTGIVE